MASHHRLPAISGCTVHVHVLARDIPPSRSHSRTNARRFSSFCAHIESGQPFSSQSSLCFQPHEQALPEQTRQLRTSTRSGPEGLQSVTQEVSLPLGYMPLIDTTALTIFEDNTYHDCLLGLHSRPWWSRDRIYHTLNSALLG